MRTLRRILLALAILLVFVIGFAAAVPFLFKDRIHDAVKRTINDQLTATVDYRDVSLGLLRSFPDLRFSVTELTLAGQGDFAGDTLLRMDRAAIDLDLMTVLRGERYQVNRVDLEHVLVHAIARNDSTVNWDILPERSTSSGDAASSPLDIHLEDVRISDAYVLYQEGPVDHIALSALNAQATVTHDGAVSDFDIAVDFDSLGVDRTGLRLRLNDWSSVTRGRVQEDDLQLPEATVHITRTDLTMNGIDYLSGVAVHADASTRLDLGEQRAAIDSLVLALNELGLRADGTVALDGDATDLDLRLATTSTSFRDLLSLIPAVYTADFADADVGGDLALSGWISGRLAEDVVPAMDLDLSIRDGHYQNPDLPAAIHDVSLDAAIRNATSSLTGLSIDIPDARLVVADEPIALSLRVDDPAGDPFVDLQADGGLDLARVPDFVEIEDITSIAGRVEASDLVFSGRVSDIENERFHDVEASGHFAVRDLALDGPAVPMPLSVPVLDLELSPRFAQLDALEASIGRSDLRATGRIDNLVSYAFGSDDLTGTLDLASTRLDIDELNTATADGGGDEATETSGVIRVPARLNITATARADELIVDSLQLTDAVARLTIREQTLFLERLDADLLGGHALISGTYSTKSARPSLAFAYEIDRFDIGQAMAYTRVMRRLAPVAKHLTGSFSSDLDLQTALRPDGSVDLSAITGNGTVRIPHAELVEMPVLDGVNNALNLSGRNTLDRPVLDNAWTVIEIRDGRIEVEPFEVTLGDLDMTIAGSNGLDKTIDYDIAVTVPSDRFGGVASAANDFLSRQSIPLLDLSVPKTLTVHLAATGAFDQPDVRIARVTADASQQSVREQVREQVEDQVNEARDEVRDQVEDQVNETRDEVRDQVEDQVDETTDEIEDRVRETFRGWGF